MKPLDRELILQHAAKRGRVLPPEAPDESPTVRAARAAIDERLGRRQEAERRWKSVLELDHRSPEQTWRAAKFLLSRGSHEGAEAALGELERAHLAGPDQIADLRAERRRREVEGFLANHLSPGHM